MVLRTKTCAKCGWVYPFDIPRAKCRFCGEPFKIGLCTKCNAESDNLREGLCEECYRARTKRASRITYIRETTSVQTSFDEWMDLVKRIPTNYPTLTNQQWLEACAYFDGCALCKSEHINTRGFFVPFKAGGRYSRWNVIPLCEECAKKYRAVDNPFRMMHRELGNSYRETETRSEHWHNSEKRLQKIVDYLRPRLEEAANDR